jgi:hypothetical protein
MSENNGATTAAKTDRAALSTAFDAMFARRHFGRFEGPDAFAPGALKAAWMEMPEEHREWARHLDAGIADMAKKLDAIDRSAPGKEKKWEEIRKANDKLEAQLVAFLMAPTQDTGVSSQNKELTRREIFQKACVDIDEKTANKAGLYTSIGAGLIGGGVAAVLAPHAALAIPHHIGEIAPAVAALVKFGAIVSTGAVGGKKAIGDVYEKVKDAAFIGGRAQRFADDPPLAMPEAPMAVVAAEAAKAKTRAKRIEELSAAATPADKIELVALKGEKILDGLEALEKWRKSLDTLGVARQMTIAQAIREAKKMTERKATPPAWANAELHALREVLENKENHRSALEMGLGQWATWQAVRAVSRENLAVEVANASIRPLTAVFTLGGLTDRLSRSREAEAGLCEPYRPRHWVRPPRS